MNQVLAATIIITAILGMGTYVGSTILETSTTSTISSSIDQQKKQEEIHAVYNGTHVTLENRGKDTSHIVKYRFYDNTANLVREIQSDDLSGGTLDDNDSTLERRVPSINEYWPSNATSGEIITSFGNVIPISMDIDPNRNNTQTSTQGNSSNPINIGQSTLGGLGVSMSIVNYDITGKLYEGIRDRTGYQYDLSSYRTVQDDTYWIAAVRDRGEKITATISMDNSKFRYNPDKTFTKSYRDNWGPELLRDHTIHKLVGKKQVEYIPATDRYPGYLLFKNTVDGSTEEICSDVTPNDKTYSKKCKKRSHNADCYDIFPRKTASGYGSYTNTATTRMLIAHNQACPQSQVSDKVLIQLDDSLKGQTLLLHTFLEPGLHVQILNSESNRLNDYTMTDNYFWNRFGYSYSGGLHGSGAAFTFPSCPSNYLPIVETRCTYGTFPTHGRYTETGVSNVIFKMQNPHPLNRPIAAHYDILGEQSNDDGCTFNQDSYSYSYRSSRYTTYSINLGAMNYGTFWCNSYNSNATHSQLFVNFPTSGTNYILITKEQVPLFNTQTYLTRDHVFSEMNRNESHLGDDQLTEAKIWLLNIPDEDQDRILTVTDLPPNTPYEIRSEKHVLVTGHSDSSGTISLRKDQVFLPARDDTPIELSIFPNSAIWIGDINNGVILDGYNSNSIQFDWQENSVYIPQAFVRLVFPKALTVTDLHIDDTSIPYLNKRYDDNSAMYIPLIPKSSLIKMKINGEYIELATKWIENNLRVKIIPEQESSDYVVSYNGAATSLAKVQTTGFYMASADGYLSAVLDIDFAGSSESTYSTKTKSQVGVPVCVGKVTDTWRWYGSIMSALKCSSAFVQMYDPPDGAKYRDWDEINEKQRGALDYYSTFAKQSAYNQRIHDSINSGSLGVLALELTVLKNMELYSTGILYYGTSAQSQPSTSLSNTFNVINKLGLSFPLQNAKTTVQIPVESGDMVEFVVNAYVSSSGLPVPGNDLLVSKFPPKPTACISALNSARGGSCTSYSNDFDFTSGSFSISQSTANIHVKNGLLLILQD